jgi:hypothetical protein
MMPVNVHSFPTSENVNLTKDLQAKIQKEKDNLEAPWLGKLPFCVDAYEEGEYADHDNIFDFMKNTAMAGGIIRFSPVGYPPALSNLDRLVRSICTLSQQHGVELISARGVRPPICKSLVCSCSVILQQRGAKNQQQEEDSKYRSESLHNDRKNNRPTGNRMLAR